MPDVVPRRDTNARIGQDKTRNGFFRIQWLHVDALPFNRTRHLRNPWNFDREVKVCRDGGELEPSEC